MRTAQNNNGTFGFLFASNLLPLETNVEADRAYYRIVEEDIESAVESRNEALQTLRELGPPDLVHLIKQSVKSGNKQVHELLTGDSSSKIILTMGR